MSLPAHRAEHVGSLLRPSGLTRAFRRLAAREIDAAAYRAAQDAAIRDAIQLQERVGLEVVTDGEFRRASYWSHFVDSVAGLAVAPSLFKFRDEIGQTQDFLAPNCDGRMHRRHPISVVEYRYLAAHTRAMPKVTWDELYSHRVTIEQAWVVGGTGSVATSPAADVRHSINAL